MVHRGKILPTTGVVGPVRDPRSRNVETGGYLPLERVPGGIDIGGPHNGAVALHAREGVAREDQRSPAGFVFAEAVVERGGVKERIHVEKFRARTDVEVGAAGRQIGLCFIGPEGVEALAEDVVADGPPVPLGGLGVCGVDVGPGAVVGQAVDRRAVGEVDEPALLPQLGIETVVGRKARPDTNHGFKSHFMKLLVHSRWVRPEPGIEVHLAHFRVVEPIHHQHVSRQMAVAIALRNRQQFLLAGVSLLALDVTVSRFGQHVRGAREQPIAGVDLVRSGAGNHEEGNTVARLGDPAGLLVEARLDRGLRSVVPQECIALVGDQERHAETGSGRSRVIGPAMDRVSAMVQKTLLILPQPVVVLVGGRVKRRAYGVELRVGGTAIMFQAGRAGLEIKFILSPAGKLKQHSAVGSANGDVRFRSGAVEVFGYVGHGMKRRRFRRQFAVHGDDHARRAVHVRLCGPARTPASSVRRRYKPVPRRGQRRFPLQAERDAQNVGRVGLQHNRLASAVKFQTRRRILRPGANSSRGECGNKCDNRQRPSHKLNSFLST